MEKAAKYPQTIISALQRDVLQTIPLDIPITKYQNNKLNSLKYTVVDMRQDKSKEICRE